MGMHAETLDIAGDELVLAFTNTVDWRTSEQPEEILTDYADLLEWGRDVGELTDDSADHLHQQAKRRPHEAQAVLERAIVLREAIYRIFEALVHGRSPSPEDLDVLNGALSKALARLQLILTPEGPAWTWADDDNGLDGILWPVVREAADMLTSQRLDRVGQCPGCGWLFLDRSRNRSRRWCSMAVCGNRAKARRHYERQREPSGRDSR